MRATEIQAGEQYAVRVDPLGVQCGTVIAVTCNGRRVEVSVAALPRAKHIVLPSAVVEAWAAHEARRALEAAERSAQLAAQRSEAESVRGLLKRLTGALRASGASLLAEELTGSAQALNIAWSGHRVSLAALQQLAQVLTPNV